MFIMNLTQHKATPEQKDAGVFDLSPEEREHLSTLLTFEEPPTLQEMETRATAVCRLAEQAFGEEGGDMLATGEAATMIGGAPFFMSTLERALGLGGFNPCYAFSRRESVEQTQPDGSVRKVNVFRHVGFV
jgi:hypothetical protein